MTAFYKQRLPEFSHSLHWGTPPPPSENTIPLFLSKPPLNQQTVQAPHF